MYLGLLTETDAIAFVSNNPSAELGSTSANGMRRVVTSKSGDELRNLRLKIAHVMGVPVSGVDASTRFKVRTVAASIKLLWANEIGYSISCGSCLAYIGELDNRSSTLDQELDGLYANLPTPDWWRSKYPKRINKLERIKEVLGQAFPIIEVPKRELKLADNEWEVVLTTAPRQEDTLTDTVNSLRMCGWEPTIFAEPNSLWIPSFKYVHNSVRLGAWHNWLASVRYALLNPDAKYILTVQDDSLFHPDSRLFIENIEWPSNAGFVSLYTAKHYSEDYGGTYKKRGVNQIVTTSLWGACALVFTRNALEQMLEHNLTKTWTGISPRHLSDVEKHNLVKQKQENPSMIQNVDTCIGMVMNSLHLGMYCVDPSPVQHISTYSSIGHANNNAGKRNCIRCAKHDKPLMEQVFNE